MITGDYHTHTRASDGHSTVTENIRAAKLRGLKQLAVTDHSFSSMLFHITREKFEAQAREIAAADKGELEVFQGVEANIFANGSIDVPDDVIRRSDILGLGFHRLIQYGQRRGSYKFIAVNGWYPEYARKKLIRENTKAYLTAMEKYPIDTLCHLNHRCLVDTAEICGYAAERGIYIELNEKHIETLEGEIGTAIASGVNFILGSDAHAKEKIGLFGRTEEFIKRCGIPRERVFGLNGNKPVFKDKSLFGKREQTR